ncbi:IS1341-type transposase [Natrinema pellirubrum DSM 15624]|uniref:IS1341-type transposase n=1 Tax=Natrinema pellirubrum (strain DSM 15624 / CIP 106293 / JCM 10476 / NCIMB 786 / 157) TaxID=797303 RepID=L0JGZ2_NATP1|nr:RNA-guided endonuclease TnpB family protein [Natrinema pellirubrum]AGB30584.1 transposase, IS605 OrfB family, central region [Natrinema pellirubrum DSM 15624]ELY74941.1 IS1341-type transposase [Natrinema pellirubrum DSM 15624]
MQKSLTKTLVFQLQPDESGQQLLADAFLEARRVYNETIRRAKNGEDWDEIRQDLESDADLVNNTAQLVVQKSLEAMENYYEYDDYNQPSHTKDGAYPLRSNYEEGYNLFLEDDCIRYRASTKPYNTVKGTLSGSPDSLEQLRHAIQSDAWRVGTAEAMRRNKNYELHINITHTKAKVREKEESRTVVGADINEDCVALAALHEEDIIDSVVIDYPEIKGKRHRYFTMRKRTQNVGKSSFDRMFERKEERFVHDRLHKVSRQVVEWVSRFEKPVIVFEDLKGMRDSIDYGTRMNCRLHSLPFRKLREFITYKAAFQGIPSDKINPKYTSQACSLTDCEHTTRVNRNKKRFKCVECGRQDHADRNAAINIAKKGLGKLNRNVPALKTLPNVRKMRRQASGCVNQPTVTHGTARSHHADGIVGVSD